MTSLPRFTSAWHRAMPWLIAVLAAGAYANAVGNGFALDDIGIIVRNDLVHSVDGVWRAFVNPYWPNGAGQYRPIVIAGFALEWAAWGERAAGYHVVNVALHAVVSLLVFHVARRWLSFGGSAIAAALFAVHPVHVEAVANTVGRSELLAAIGVLAMLLLHARRSGWAVAAFALALFSKEHALVAPALAVLVDLGSPRRPAPDRASTKAAPTNAAPTKGSADRARAVRFGDQWWHAYAAYAAVAAVWMAVVLALFAGKPLAAVDPLWKTIDAPARWLTMLGVVTVWVRLLFAPFELTADYSPRVTLPWPDNAALALLGGVILAAVLVFAAAVWRRDRRATLAVLWIAVCLAPVANVLVPTGVIVAERTLYLASVGAVLLIGMGAEWLGRRAPGVTVAVAMLVTVAFGARTWTRTPAWESNRTLLLATAESHPGASWTHVLLARVYAGNGGFEQARQELARSLELFDGNSVAWADAIENESRTGNFARADSLVGEARRRLPDGYLVSVAHAYVALQLGRHAESIRASRTAIAAAPDSSRARLIAARAWLAAGYPDSAVRELRAVRSGDPRRGEADSLLAIAGRDGQ